MYGNVRDYEHWSSEINGWLKSIQRYKLKGSKERLSRDTLMKILWEGMFEYVEEIQEHMGEIDREYSKSYKIMEYQPALLHKQLREIMLNICDDLSQGKFLDIKNYL
jgi:hypothetical protein